MHVSYCMVLSHVLIKVYANKEICHALAYYMGALFTGVSHLYMHALQNVLLMQMPALMAT